MAFTINNSNTGAGGAGNTIAVVVTGVLAGDLVVLFTSHDSGAVTMTASDGTSSLTGLSLGSTGSLRGQLFYLLSSVATGSVTYTVTYSLTTTLKTCLVYVFTPSAAVTFDVEGIFAAAIGTAIDSTNITTTGTDELVFGYACNELGQASSAETLNGSSVTGVLRNGGGTLGYLAFGSTFTGDFKGTLASNDRHLENLAGFKITGAAVTLAGARTSPIATLGEPSFFTAGRR